MSSAALFRVLYENEVLFRLEESRAALPAISPEKPAGSAVSVAAPPPFQPTPRPVPAEVAETVQPAFPALQHKVLVLVNDRAHPTLPVSEAAFLDNVLKAVGHSSATSDILNFSHLPGPDARQMVAERRTHYFITFGVPMIRLQVDMLLVPYTPKFKDGIWFLLADPLHTIEADRNLKKKLWQALQQMFQTS